MISLSVVLLCRCSRTAPIPPGILSKALQRLVFYSEAEAKDKTIQNIHRLGFSHFSIFRIIITLNSKESLLKVG